MDKTKQKNQKKKTQTQNTQPTPPTKTTLSGRQSQASLSANSSSSIPCGGESIRRRRWSWRAPNFARKSALWFPSRNECLTSTSQFLFKRSCAAAMPEVHGPCQKEDGDHRVREAANTTVPCEVEPVAHRDQLRLKYARVP